jgi:predicted hotdog family 3-hydroxylacyl-ACP dehydratase
LPALAAIEYGAQAIAVHGGLKPVPAEREGLIAGVRAVQCHVNDLDQEEGALTVQAKQLVADGTRLLYAFSVHGGERLLVSGRIAVVLGTDASRSRAGG